MKNSQRLFTIVGFSLASLLLVGLPVLVGMNKKRQLRLIAN